MPLNATLPSLAYTAGRHLHAPELQLRLQVFLLVQQLPPGPPPASAPVRIGVPPRLAPRPTPLPVLLVRRQARVAREQVLLQLLQQRLRVKP